MSVKLLDGVENLHLLVLHALDDQEQRIEPHILSFHAQTQTALEHVLAMRPRSSLSDAMPFCGAQRDDDRVVRRRQIDAVNAVARVRAG